jgi:hypothetical protein
MPFSVIDATSTIEVCAAAHIVLLDQVYLRPLAAVI